MQSSQWLVFYYRNLTVDDKCTQQALLDVRILHSEVQELTDSRLDMAEAFNQALRPFIMGVELLPKALPAYAAIETLMIQ
jgi:hypothetical protein